MDLTNTKLELEQLIIIGNYFTENILRNKEAYNINSLDLYFINNINRRSLIYLSLQIFSRLRFKDLKYLIKFSFFKGNEVFIKTSKKGNIVRFQLLERMDSEFLQTLNVKLIIKYFRYSTISYDYKNVIRSLNLPKWFPGMNVTHSIRKSVATALSIENEKDKTIMRILQQLDIKSQKFYIYPTVLNNFFQQQK